MVRRAIAVILLCCFAVTVQAQQVCRQWRMNNANGDSGWVSDAQAAMDAWAAQCRAGGSCHTNCSTGPLAPAGKDNEYRVTLGTTAVFPNYISQQSSWECATGNPTGWTSITGLSTRQDPSGCPTCPAAGTRRGSIQIDPASPGDTVCGNDGCVYTVDESPAIKTELNGGAGSIIGVRATGQACAATEPATGAPEGEPGECVEGGGTMACLDKDAPPGQGCGYFNGDYVCTGHVPDDSCVSFASGGVACTADSPDAPKGADGEPLEPTGSVSNGPSTVDYFDPATVAGATTPATTRPGQGGSASGAPGRDGSGASGTGSGSGGSTTINCPEGATTPCVNNGTINSGSGAGGAGDGDGECEAEEGCSNPELEEVCEFGECAQSFYNRIKAAPLVAGVLEAGAAMPAGSCPNWSLAAFESDYSLSAPMCEIWDQVSPLLSAVFLVIWGWVATRIVLSA